MKKQAGATIMPAFFPSVVGFYDHGGLRFMTIFI